MDSNILHAEILKTIETAKKGGIFLYPTDTIWGLGCDARNFDAIKKIYEIKKRPAEKRFILIFPNIEMLASYADIDLSNWQEYTKNDSSPTTYVIQTEMKLPKILSSEGCFWAIRIANNEFCQRVCLGIGAPIVSTSANTSGNPNPINYNEIESRIKQMVDLVVNPMLDIGTGQASDIYKIENNLKVKLR